MCIDTGGGGQLLSHLPPFVLLLRGGLSLPSRLEQPTSGPHGCVSTSPALGLMVRIHYTGFLICVDPASSPPACKARRALLIEPCPGLSTNLCKVHSSMPFRTVTAWHNNYISIMPKTSSLFTIYIYTHTLYKYIFKV